MKRIILTGGGTAGHVTPNIALLPHLRDLEYDIHYIGSHNGIEKDLIEPFGIPFYGISSGKLRRYFSLKNLTDPFRVIKGLAEADSLIKQLEPDIVFSKGGFVSVPVVVAAKRRRVPVVIHESDMTPGLANKLSLSSAAKICCNFPETVELFPEGKAILTGSPIREELLKGDPEKAREFLGFNKDKPVLLIIGGSLGSVFVNDAVRAVIHNLLENFQVIHLCGKGKLDESLNNTIGYKQYEYIKEELADIFALSDIVISRAGANAICELLAIRKPNLLIPLSSKASRGDQVLNARSFERQGFSMVLEEEEVTNKVLLSSIMDLYTRRADFVKTMQDSGQHDSIATIISLFEEILNDGTE
ncbi:MAG: undecaprenyldiphospho-muramoylpentapeptide beta-N-acetylglucosaminyltransferase [Lachnospiraceae bacterium]|jgi:UDP-N-acetylglucosamine--N-acetylmuramyl-(pentapeptide) pyrophosphoryl-undecaprenol N-acetylglucosamine transferase|nr:undecaprenyldiphospho-muramoylpentapeptide beta-N-acetylglucosaminyltransferase [Lachnospiraceae bacterium]